MVLLTDFENRHPGASFERFETVRLSRTPRIRQLKNRLEIRNVRNSSLPMFLFLPSNRDREDREIQNVNFAPAGSTEAGFFVEVNKNRSKINSFC